MIEVQSKAAKMLRFEIKEKPEAGPEQSKFVELEGHSITPVSEDDIKYLEEATTTDGKWFKQLKESGDIVLKVPGEKAEEDQQKFQQQADDVLNQAKEEIEQEKQAASKAIETEKQTLAEYIAKLEANLANKVAENITPQIQKIVEEKLTPFVDEMTKALEPFFKALEDAGKVDNKLVLDKLTALEKQLKAQAKK